MLQTCMDSIDVSAHEFVKGASERTDCIGACLQYFLKCRDSIIDSCMHSAMHLSRIIILPLLFVLFLLRMSKTAVRQTATTHRRQPIHSLVPTTTDRPPRPSYSVAIQCLLIYRQRRSDERGKGWIILCRVDVTDGEQLVV